MTNDHLDTCRVDAVSYVVIDFETLTPKGRPPEPIEVAAMRVGPGLVIERGFRVERFIRPPHSVSFTPFDTAQTGIRLDDVRTASTAEVVLKEINDVLRTERSVIVAQNARYEYAIMSRFSEYCPDVVSMPFVDTVRLGKRLLPTLPNYKLDTLAAHFGVQIPYDRHRALPDVKVTVNVLVALLEMLMLTDDNQVADLRRIAGVQDPGARPIQISLFD